MNDLRVSQQFFLFSGMAVLKNYPCQFALGMVFAHLLLLGVVSYKYLQYLGLQVDYLSLCIDVS